MSREWWFEYPAQWRAFTKGRDEGSAFCLNEVFIDLVIFYLAEGECLDKEPILRDNFIELFYNIYLEDLPQENLDEEDKVYAAKLFNIYEKTGEELAKWGGDFVTRSIKTILRQADLYFPLDQRSVINVGDIQMSRFTLTEYHR